MANRTNILKASAILLGALLVAALSVAQGGAGQHEGRRGFGGMGGGNNSMMLLRRTDVQTDLNLSADQKSKLTDLMTSMRKQFRRPDAQSGTPPSQADRDAMRPKMEAARADMEKQVNSILTPEQQSRLKEISIQLRGNMAIMDKDVQSQLDLTKDQKEKIKNLQEGMRAANQSIGEKMQSGSITQDAAMQSFQNNMKAMQTSLGAILTPAQAEKLKTLGGAPFKADPAEEQRTFGFGGRGGRRGGGGGQ